MSYFQMWWLGLILSTQRTVLRHLLCIKNCHFTAKANHPFLSLLLFVSTLRLSSWSFLVKERAATEQRTSCHHAAMVLPILKMLAQIHSCLCFLRCYGKKCIREGLPHQDVNLYGNRNRQKGFCGALIRCRVSFLEFNNFTPIFFSYKQFQKSTQQLYHVRNVP